MASRLLQSSLSKFGFKSPQIPAKTPKSEKRVIQKENYESNKRKRGFVESWTERFQGLKDTDNGMVCGICQGRTQCRPGEDRSFLVGCKSYRIDTIRSHWESAEHISCCMAEAVEQRGHGPLDVIIERIGDSNKFLLEKMFNTAYTIMKHEMPFTDYPLLLQLQQKNGSDLKNLISYGTDTACKRFAPYIDQAIQEPLRDSLNRSTTIAVLFDGATDSSISEVEIVYVRFLENGYPQDWMLGLADLEHAHADGTFSAIDRVMTSFVGEQWLDKLVAAGSDGASVNIGRNDSVATRLMDHGREYVVPVHCVAHRLELSILSAIRNHRMMETTQDLLKKLYKHYHFSPKALRELRQIADLMDERIIKPTRLEGTRWVPHIQKACAALIRGFQPLLAHFEHISEARPGAYSAEVRGRASFVCRKLTDFRVLKFIFFMQDLLDIVSDLSLNFQKDASTCVYFLDALESAMLCITELRTEPGPSYAAFIAEVAQQEGQYKGTAIDHYDPDQDYNFAAEICDLVIAYIQTRFEENNNQATSCAVMKAGRIFDLRDWPLDRDDLVQYGNVHIDFLANHFGIFLQRVGCDVAQLRNEWMLVKAHFGNRLRNNRANQVPKINTLFVLQDPRFTNILRLVEIILVIPTSTAGCERGFSAVKRIKSDWRSRLTTVMMNHLLFVSFHGPSLMEYQAERAIHLWWTAGARQRRPQFRLPQLPGGQDHQDDGEDELYAYMMGQIQEL